MTNVIISVNRITCTATATLETIIPDVEKDQMLPEKYSRTEPIEWFCFFE